MFMSMSGAYFVMNARLLFNKIKGKVFRQSLIKFLAALRMTCEYPPLGSDIIYFNLMIVIGICVYYPSYKRELLKGNRM